MDVTGVAMDEVTKTLVDCVMILLEDDDSPELRKALERRLFDVALGEGLVDDSTPLSAWIADRPDHDYADLAADLRATLSRQALLAIGEWQQYESCQPEGAARVVDELAQIMR